MKWSPNSVSIVTKFPDGFHLARIKFDPNNPEWFDGFINLRHLSDVRRAHRLRPLSNAICRPDLSAHE